MRQRIVAGDGETLWPLRLMVARTVPFSRRRLRSHKRFLPNACAAAFCRVWPRGRQFTTLLAVVQAGELVPEDRCVRPRPCPHAADHARAHDSVTNSTFYSSRQHLLCAPPAGAPCSAGAPAASGSPALAGMSHSFRSSNRTSARTASTPAAPSIVMTFACGT